MYKSVTMLAELSVVIPVFNEQGILPQLISALIKQCTKCSDKYELIIVNDASNDKSLQILQNLTEQFSALKVINLKENQGQFLATITGLRQCNFQHILIMDGDLQDSPEDIPLLIEKYASLLRKHFSVFAVRSESKNSSLIKLATLTYHIILNFIVVHWPKGIGSFLITSSDVVDNLLELLKTTDVQNVNISIPIYYMSLHTGQVFVPRQKRYDDISRIGFWGLFQEGINSIRLLRKLKHLKK